jgi:uncharacterized protein YbaR (Trm112 family)
MGHNGICPNCNQRFRVDSSEIYLLKSTGLFIQKFGVICPYCSSNIIISDDFNEGESPLDNWPNVNRRIEGQCPNCAGRLGYEEHGYVETHVKICPKCGLGCMKLERDNTPGFRDRYLSPCCKCRFQLENHLEF